jgi:L-serine dehydratase
MPDNTASDPRSPDDPGASAPASPARGEDANLSVMDLFTIGIGPSSSHTVGPMRAARRFAAALDDAGVLGKTARVKVTLYGSLALTGMGHGTDKAVLLGLSGERPSTVDPDAVDGIIAAIRADRRLALAGSHAIPFDAADDLALEGGTVLEAHPNALKLEAFDAAGAALRDAVFYSVGGGFIVEEGAAAVDAVTRADNIRLKYPFGSAAELLAVAEAEGLTIAQVMLANEGAWREEAETFAFLDRIHDAMNACIERGLSQEGMLPGGLDVERRAKKIHADLLGKPEAALRDPLTVLDWVDLYALAVNEENAAGGRVVTAPTNGAAGIIPAVLRYYQTFCSAPSQQGMRDFLLTAAAIGSIYKKRASISGAEVGCQGEVGVACSMAAAGLAAAKGGSNAQIENAAEIGMEHNLGLTCDPVGGLVQIPCIERNAMGAVKAINAARLALHGTGKHKVSLDQVIETMRQTGRDMQSKYKETSQGGLAVNVVEC